MVVRDASDAVVDFQSKQLHVAKPEWLRQFLLEEGEEQTVTWLELKHQKSNVLVILRLIWMLKPPKSDLETGLLRLGWFWHLWGRNTVVQLVGHAFVRE